MVGVPNSSVLAVANLYSACLFERCLRLVEEKHTLNKANLDISKACGKSSNDNLVDNVVKCRLYYVIVKGV